MASASPTDVLIVVRAEDKRIALVNCAGLFALWATRLGYDKDDKGEFVVYLHHALDIRVYELHDELENDAVRAAVEYTLEHEDADIVFCEVSSILVGELDKRSWHTSEHRPFLHKDRLH
ncbi:MAG: hypothetical protein FVQ76_04625 [Nitrospira sp.]|nr:hypothetical protein [Nitrospira sp.]